MADSVTQATQHQSTFANHHTPAFGTALSIIQSPPHASTIVLQHVDSITMSFALLRSPNRRKTHRGNIVPPSTSTAVVASSPRHGQNSKQTRLTRPPAITDNIGWGQCTIKEFVQFCEGDEVIIIIPADHKNDSKYATSQRKQFRDRVIDAVGQLIHNVHTTYRSTESAHQTRTNDNVSANHGIERNQKEYTKLRCLIEKYPNRESYICDLIHEKEITCQLRQRGGFDFIFLIIR
jgi:hypothetical protein